MSKHTVPTVSVSDNTVVITRDGISNTVAWCFHQREALNAAREIRGALADAFHAGRQEAEA